MIKFKRLTIALLALLSISAGAWAQTVEVKELTVPESWNGDNTLLSATDLPDYQAAQLNDAKAWADAPQGYAMLFYKVSTSEINNITFSNGNFSSDGSLNQLSHSLLYTWKNSSGYRFFYTAAPAEPEGIEVTITGTSAEGQQATFTMPDYDVTATYALKRDMAVEMSVSVQDAQQNSRFRVQKQNNVFVPVGLTNEQVMALFKVHDDIESKDLTAATDYTVQIFAVDDEGQPTGTAMTFQNFTYAPGQYIVKAVAAEGSNYSGETALSNVFTLFQGYEVEVAAKEFITYYKDEPLYVEDEAAQLYTIQSVSADQAVLSAAIETAPSLTPLLIFNNSDQAKTFLLIPANEEPNLQLTVAPEFQGTLTGTTIAASTDAQTNYAFNGKAFVFVKNAIEVGPNKAWLEIPNQQSNVKALRIIFGGDATGVNEVNEVIGVNDKWYDLNGRKLNGMPTKRGIYVKNGRKVIVK